MLVATQLVNIVSVVITTTKPIPFKIPFYDATMGPFDSIILSILSITDSEGNKEEVPINTSTIPYLENILIPCLLSMKDVPYETAITNLYWMIRNEGYRGNASVALGQLDYALHCLFAKREGLSLRKYYGNDIHTVNVYASGGSVLLSDKELVNEMCSYVDEGYSSLKMKFGRGGLTNFKSDLSRIKKVRKAIGLNTALAIDSNQVFKAHEAIEVAKVCEDLNISWLEEPVHSADLEAIKKVCENSPIPIAFGESERSGKVVDSLIRAGVKHVQVIAGYLSTMTEWLEAAKLCKSKQIAFSSGGFSQFNCHWIALAGADAYTEYLIPVISYLNPLLAVKPYTENGKFILTDLPGLGIAINWNYINQHSLISSQKKFNYP